MQIRIFSFYLKTEKMFPDSKAAAQKVREESHDR